MGLFRKKETLNEQLLREAGLDRVVFNTPPQAPIDAGPLPGTTGDISRVYGERRRTRDWDTTATATAPGVSGDRVEFTALPTGDLIVTSEVGDGDLSPLADAIEAHVAAPYAAVAWRQKDDVWEVGAEQIEVAEFTFAGGDDLELSESDGVAELRVDGAPSDATAPVELKRLGERIERDFCVGASRIDGNYWEVWVTPL